MRRTSFASVVALVLMAGIALAQNITFDFDKSANFAEFATYTWERGHEVPDELNHKRIVNAIDGQLAAKGLTRVSRQEQPDLLVAYHAVFDRDLQVSGFSSGWGPYRFGPGASGTARAEQILKGTLIVDIVDRSTGTIVWRGTATKDIDVKADGEKRERNINKAAEKLFKHYPPAE